MPAKEVIITAWIELHDEISMHKKTYSLMDALHIRRRDAVGILSMLWTWALKAAPDGEITAFPPRAIADATDWNHKPQTLIDALIKCGWLDKSENNRLFIHDWDSYTWRYFDKMEQTREQTAKRVREYRKRKKTLLNNEENVTAVTSSPLQVTQCNAPTEPNRTLLDLSNDKSYPNSNSDVSKFKKETYNFDHGSEPYKLAAELTRMIHENNPSAKQQDERDLQRWAKTFDLMIRRDSRTAAQIWDVMRFSQQDNFWKVNILSADALRKQFDRLTLKKGQGR